MNTSTALAVVKHKQDPSTIGARRRHAATMIAKGATRAEVRAGLAEKFGKGLGAAWLNAAFSERRKAAEMPRARRRARDPKLPGDARIACAFMAAGIAFSFDGKHLRLALEALT